MTVREALIRKVNYPLHGYVDVALIDRGLSGDEEYTTDVAKSNEFIGAFADCLRNVLVQGLNLSESDKSISLLTDKDKRLLSLINSLYSSIGEDELDLGQPMVYI